MIGTTISHYRVVGKLGEGGMGIVYLAEDIVLGRRVAIKTLGTKTGGEDQHFRARFLREARSVSALSHPHIATIYDYGESETDMPYIVMELIEGPTLADLIRQESLTLPRIVTIIRQVAEALGEAHRQGIIHRDIKPSNVATDKRGDVKVLDFGLAKQLDLSSVSDPERQTLLHTQTGEGVIVGTPMYLSPEQARGVDIDARSDLFSLGALLYECIAGKPTFFGKSPAEICARVLRDDPPPPSKFNSQVPRLLDQVTLKALAKKPEARYQTAEEMIAALDEVEASLQPSSHDRTVTRLMASSAGIQPSGTLATLSDIFKRPRLSIGYVAGGLLLIALMGFGLWRLTRPSIHTPKPEALRLYDRAVEAMREGAFFRASKLLQQVVQEDSEFALAHARLAEAWTELDSSDKAKDELIRTKNLVPDSSILPRVDGLRLQAVTDTVQREFAKAVEDYKTIVSSGPANEKAYALVDLGRAYEKNEQSAKAIETYEEASRADPHHAAAFLRRGALLGRGEKYAEAYKSLDEAYKLFDLNTDVEGLTEVLLQRGVVLGLAGKVADARQYLTQALEKSKALENSDKRIKILLNFSNTEIIAGNPDQARQYSSQAVELAKTNGLDNLTMQGLIDIGNAYLNKGNFPEAEKNFKEALRLAELYKGARSKARAFLSLSSLNSQQGNTEAARDFFQHALPFYEQGGYRKEVFALYVILGRAEVGAGDYDAAQHRFEELLKRAQEASDPQSTAWAQEGLGRLYLAREDLPKALSYYRANYETAKSLNSKLVMGYTANNCGEILWRLGRDDEARASLAEALSIAEPPGKEPLEGLQAEVHLTKARMALGQRKPADSLTEVKKALEIPGSQSQDTLVETNYLMGLAQSLSGQTSEGLKLCNEAVRMARELKKPLMLSTALLALAESALKAGDSQTTATAATEAQQRFAAAHQYESEWRAWLLLASAAEKAGDKTSARDFGQRALGVLGLLESEWPADSYQTYVKREQIALSKKELNRLSLL